MHKCNVCKTIFDDKDLLDYHKRLSHAKEMKILTKCNICNIEFGFKALLDLHTASEHTEKIKCGTCGFLCNDIPHLDSHIDKGEYSAKN